MAVLVTGGAGYIGSHTCVELLDHGYEVIVIDNFKNSNPEALRRINNITGKQFKSYEVSLLDQKALEIVFEENEIEAVIHLAGLKAVGESVDFPHLYYKNNVTGTLILTEVMDKYGVNNLVFSSSATVYGTPDKVPIKEDSPLHVTNPYGRSKLMIEEILYDLYQSNSKWSITTLRYFNPIGAHKSGLIGEDPYGTPNNLLPYVSQVAIGKLSKLSVFGDDYPTNDGTGVRDYIHVVDLAKGHLKALTQVFGSRQYNTYNLGTGKGYSVLDIINAFEKVSQKRIPYSIVDRRIGDIAICYADPEKAKKDLGWTAEKDITEMCEDTWNWQVLNPHGYSNRGVEV